MQSQATGNSNQPSAKSFNDLNAAFQNFQPQDSQIIYLTVGAYTKAGHRDSLGYAQGLPLFLERLLKDSDWRNRINVMHIDRCWADYQQSDLARHIKQEKLEYIENRFTFVTNWIEKEDFSSLISNLLKILEKNGTVFIAEYEGPGMIVVYDELLKSAHDIGLDTTNRVFYLQWLTVFKQHTHDNKQGEVAVVVWDGSPSNRIDYAIFQNALFALSNIIELLKEDSNFLKVEARRKDRVKTSKKLSPDEIASELANIDDVIEKYLAERVAIRANIKNKNALLEYIANYLSFENFFLRDLEITPDEFEMIQKNVTNQMYPFRCRLASLIPTRQVPLLDFVPTSKSDSLEPISTSFNIFDLFNETCLMDYVASQQPNQDNLSNLSTFSLLSPGSTPAVTPTDIEKEKNPKP